MKTAHTGTNVLSKIPPRNTSLRAKCHTQYLACGPNGGVQAVWRQQRLKNKPKVTPFARYRWKNKVSIAPWQFLLTLHQVLLRPVLRLPYADTQ